MNSYLALTKPRLTALSVLSGVTGYLLGGGTSSLLTGQFFWTLLGVCLLGGGANSLNMLMEREHDAKMNRTKKRPLPSQQLTWQQVLAYAMTISACGLYILSALVNPLAGWLGLMTLVSYVLVYTPLKRKTTFCTLVGAIPGALPPLIGYAAATGGYLDRGAVFFGMILFMWQMPHFFSLSWIYREDYRRAGFAMLCVVDDERGSMTSRQVNMFTLFLLPVSLAPTIYHYTGSLYLIGATVLGIGFLVVSVVLFKGVTDKAARRVFRYSNIYLVLLMTLMVVDRSFGSLSLDSLLESLLM